MLEELKHQRPWPWLDNQLATTNKQCGQEDAATYGPVGPPCENLAASDYNKLNSLGSLSQHYNGSRATYIRDYQKLMY